MCNVIRETLGYCFPCCFSWKYPSSRYPVTHDMQNRSLLAAINHGKIPILPMKEVGISHCVSPRGHEYIVKSIESDNEGDNLRQLAQKKIPFSIFPFAHLEKKILMEKGCSDLFDLRKNSPRFSLSKIYKIARQISTYMSALKKERLIHHDIKPENIFVLSKESLEIRVGGVLGLRKNSEQGDKRPPMTVRYAAPELFIEENGPYDHAFDVWSFGCTLYALITKETFSSKFSGLLKLYALETVLGDFPESFKSEIHQQRPDIYFTRNENSELVLNSLKPYENYLFEVFKKDYLNRSWEDRIRFAFGKENQQEVESLISLLSRMLAIEREKRITIEEVDAYFAKGHNLARIDLEEEVLQKREDFSLQINYVGSNTSIQKFINGTISYHHIFLPTQITEEGNLEQSLLSNVHIILLKNNIQVAQLNSIAVKTLKRITIGFSKNENKYTLSRENRV